MPQNDKHSSQGPEVFSFPDLSSEFLGSDIVLTRQLSGLETGKAMHFYSWANFNLVRLILHLIKLTGPAHLLMTSYTFSQRSIEAMLSRKLNGQLLSVRIITDNRVKSMSPKPFQMLRESFDVRCTSVHAKVALIYNDSWKVSVITSQNATDNPKMERGIIFTDTAVFNFDFKILENEFNNGAAG